MISFRPVNNLTEMNVCLRNIKGIEADFFDVPVDNAVMFRMIRDRKICGAVCAFEKDRTVFLRMHFEEMEPQVQNEVLQTVMHRIISVYHPLRVLSDHFHGLDSETMRKNMFYSIGMIYARDIEPWRYVVRDQVFDDNGNIINQGDLKDLPFGWFSTREKGCGWIAAYNLLRMNGREHTMENCAVSLERYGFTGKLFGQEVFTLAHWLKKEGLPIHISMMLKGQTAEKMKHSSTGILLYTHKRGSHYTAYRNAGNGTVQFYNAVYGARNMIITPEAFIKKYVLLPWMFLIYID